MTHTISDNSKGCIALIIPVLRVKIVRFGLSDVPLSIRRVWVLTASHSYSTIDMGKIWIYFQRNGLPRATAATLWAGEWISTDLGTGWIAALDNEIIDHTVEENSVINSVLDVLDHVLCRDWSPLLKQFNHNNSVGAGIKVSGNIGNFEFDYGVALVGELHWRVFRFGSVSPHGWVNANRAPSTVASLCTGHWCNGHCHA